MNQYEAMFVIDPTFGADFADCEAEIRRLMDRADAEVVFLRRWDERRLAYRIKGRKRGVYVLVYFNADPGRIKGLERDAQLAEHILRLLVLCAEGVNLEMMEKTVSGRGAPADAGGPQESEKPDTPGDMGTPKPETEMAPAAEPPSMEADVLVADAPLDEKTSEAT